MALWWLALEIWWFLWDPEKQRPFTPLSPWVALCTCWGVAHAVRDPAWRLCFKCSLLLAAASRQTAGPYGLSCPSTLGGWAGQKSGAGRSGPTRAGCEHSAPCLLSRRAVVSPREDSWRLPHETETASLFSFVVLGCPVHVLGGRPRGTRPGPGVFALNVACCLPLAADRQLGLTA